MKILCLKWGLLHHRATQLLNVNLIVSHIEDYQELEYDMVHIHHQFLVNVYIDGSYGWYFITWWSSMWLTFST